MKRFEKLKFEEKKKFLEEKGIKIGETDLRDNPYNAYDGKSLLYVYNNDLYQIYNPLNNWSYMGKRFVANLGGIEEAHEYMFGYQINGFILEEEEYKKIEEIRNMKGRKNYGNYT